MKLAKQIETYKRLREQSLWKLLAADHAPVVLALIGKHFLDGERRVPQSMLHERIEADLEQLRSDGADLPQRAQIYVSEWLSAGYLERYFPTGAHEEEYEITAAAAQAIRFINSVNERRTAATESRLGVVIHQLVTLADETDTNQSNRIASLLRERERLDQQIKEAEAGHLHALEDAQALERIREIIALADDLVGDFRHVRDKFSALNRELREKLMDETDRRGEVLDDLFAGVDLIGESEAGRTFSAFWRLLTDPLQNKSLEEALDVLPERSFCKELRLDERQFLRRLIRILLEQGGSVHDVLQNFARSLKNFVQSREFLEQRHISQLLNQAQKAALDLRDIIGVTEKLEFDLPLTSCRIRSLAQLCLLDPSTGLSDTSIAYAATADISLDLVSDLVAQSEIDFKELRSNILQCLSYAHQVSIGELLDRFPATQGLGSVIGYISIGSRHGLIVPNQSEHVKWKGNDGVERLANIPLIFFRKDSADDFR
jgi:hypothetical protein